MKLSETTSKPLGSSFITMSHLQQQRMWAFLAGMGVAGTAYMSTRVSHAESVSYRSHSRRPQH